MSDYLENQAAKALNQIEGLQPRVASLFESPSAAGRPMTARLPANEEAAPGEPFSSGPLVDAPLPPQEAFNDAWPSRPPTRGRPAASRPPQPPGIPDPVEDPPPEQWVYRQPAPLLTPQAADSTSGQIPVQPGPNLARTIPTASPAASSSTGAARPLDVKTAHPSHPDTPTLVPVTAGQETAVGPSTPTAKKESLSALEQIIVRTVDERTTLLDAPQFENITHPEPVSVHARLSSTPAMPVVQPHVTLYREPPISISSEGTAMPEPAPTIKITIGRVDVRAIMPAAPAPRPAPTRPSPALSLDDYLKQREGGRR